MNSAILLAADTNSWDGIINALSGTFSPSQIVSVVTSGLTIAVPMVLVWWAGRKVVRIIMASFRSGRASI